MPQELTDQLGGAGHLGCIFLRAFAPDNGAPL